MSTDEYRRAPRRKAPHTIHVIDAMTDTVVGRLGNLSETGMLLTASTQLVDDALYQLRFNLGGDASSGSAGQEIEVGAHLLWQDGTGASGQNWTGLRFINILDSQLQQLKRWIEAPGGAFE